MSEKYAFIAGEYTGNQAADAAAPTMARMCSWLGVSKSGYYEWLDRPPSAAQQRRDLLKLKITTLFKEFGATYGYRRIHAELVRAGEQVGDELVRTLMRELDLVPVQPRLFRTTTVRGADEPDTPDLVRRDFSADRPGVTGRTTAGMSRRWAFGCRFASSAISSSAVLTLIPASVSTSDRWPPVGRPRRCGSPIR